MKELRPPATYLRVLFTFNPQRTATLLIGGNKERRWQKWYQDFIPVANALYDEHLVELRQQGETT
jgi:hypothetical protein